MLIIGGRRINSTCNYLTVHVFSNAQSTITKLLSWQTFINVCIHYVAFLTETKQVPTLCFFIFSSRQQTKTKQAQKYPILTFSTRPMSFHLFALCLTHNQTFCSTAHCMPVSLYGILFPNYVCNGTTISRKQYQNTH